MLERVEPSAINRETCLCHRLKHTTRQVHPNRLCWILDSRKSQVNLIQNPVVLLGLFAKTVHSPMDLDAAATHHRRPERPQELLRQSSCPRFAATRKNDLRVLPTLCVVVQVLGIAWYDPSDPSIQVQLLDEIRPLLIEVQSAGMQAHICRLLIQSLKRRRVSTHHDLELHGVDVSQIDLLFRGLATLNLAIAKQHAFGVTRGAGALGLNKKPALASAFLDDGKHCLAEPLLDLALPKGRELRRCAEEVAVQEEFVGDIGHSRLQRPREELLRVPAEVLLQRRVHRDQHGGGGTATAACSPSLLPN
mmetsp:Transcript_174178/g.558528  ORF Transcript_174178/g.558528 Transcript_174178/m.558528 type:complete len:306 (-) Transcript_174178:2065-2982(-)